ncbi:hypothetical protein Lal_00027510 [Lupinus albus]|nr:hypothetical protein Lal_00027510 [Lupinus albus]
MASDFSENKKYALTDRTLYEPEKGKEDRESSQNISFYLGKRWRGKGAKGLDGNQSKVKSKLVQDLPNECSKDRNFRDLALHQMQHFSVCDRSSDHVIQYGAPLTLSTLTPLCVISPLWDFSI